MNSNWNYSPETLNSDRNQLFFVSCDLEIWRMTLKNNGAPHWADFDQNVALIYATFWSKSAIFVPCDLEMWRMTLKNNRALLLCQSKLYALFRSHVWIQTAVAVRKRQNWDKICFDLGDFDLWSLTLTFYMEITFVSGNKSWKISW